MTRSLLRSGLPPRGLASSRRITPTSQVSRGCCGWTGWLTCCLLLASFGPSETLEAQDLQPTAFPQAQLDFFESRIRPVLVEHCYRCHSGDSEDLKAGLRLDTFRGVRDGGESGPLLIPGKPQESLLISALRHESFEMPPDKRLPKTVIADFEEWIRSGAADPRPQASGRSNGNEDHRESPADASDHWAFQPLLEQHPPQVGASASWVRTPIDRFILARLEREGLSPNPRASRPTLLRRLFVDLAGIPAEVEQAQRMLADSGEDAYERWVEQLLSAPSFGERWGRHWLDVARFAESSGGGRTTLFQEAWRYRDFVVDAFNRDMPFDQFITYQLCGDLLTHPDRAERARQLTATSFLALGPINYELQDKAKLRMEVVDEQLNTVGRAFLGMTFGCARCHDHKFDPISMKDYYAMAGVFRSTKSLVPGNVSGFVTRPLPDPPELQQRRATHARQVAELTQRLKRLDGQLEKSQLRLADGPPFEGGIVIDDSQATLRGTWTQSQSVRPFVGEHYLVARDNSASIDFAPQVAAGSFDVYVAYSAHSNRATNVQLEIKHGAGTTRLELDQTRPPPAAPWRHVGRFTFKERGGKIRLSYRDADGVVIADAISLVPVEPAKPRRSDTDRAAEPREEQRVEGERLEKLRRERSRVAVELETLQRDAPRPAAFVMSVEEQAKIEDCPLLIRGNVHQTGPAIPRAVPQALRTGSESPMPPAQSGRKEFAEWITHPQHPLTARVIVNRVWQNLLGEGLVRTPDNFGTTGQAPSHPELLDYLALQFIRHNQSVKWLVREIVTSHVYQMSSAPSVEGNRVDPRNQLLHRAHARRLDAEVIRDSLLAFSHRLDRTMGGPTIRPGTRSEFDYPFENRRRSLYEPVFRNGPHGLLDVFDQANPNLVHGKRTNSTRATQALYLMNSPLARETASRAARHALSLSRLSDSQRLEYLYQSALGRSPTPRETQLCLEYLQALPSTEEAWTEICHTLICCIDFQYRH